jgi:hypothetical protein
MQSQLLCLHTDSAGRLHCLQGRLEERKEVWGLFPAAWRVPQVLCLTFCKITKVRGGCLSTGCLHYTCSNRSQHTV